MFWKQPLAPIPPLTTSSSSIAGNNTPNTISSNQLNKHTNHRHSSSSASTPTTTTFTSYNQKSPFSPASIKHDHFKETSLYSNSPCSSEDLSELRTLPVDFEKSIRQLEIRIASASTVDLDTVRELIMLYTLAVEYYDSNNDDKFIYYKNKIVYLHQQQNVIDAMNNQTFFVESDDAKSKKSMNACSSIENATISNNQMSPSLKNRTSTNSNSIQKTSIASVNNSVDSAASTNKRGCLQLQRIEEQSQVCVTDADVRELLDTEDDKQFEQEVIIEKDLKKQHNNIQKRLNLRIKASQASKDIQSQTPRGAFVTKDLLADNDHQISGSTRPMTARSYSETVKELKEEKQEQKPLQQNELVDQKNDIVQQQMIETFVNLKKRSLMEEMSLKMDQLNFQFEKLMFEKERDTKQQLDDSTRNSLLAQKQQKAAEIEADFIEREKQHIAMIYANFNGTATKSLQQ